MISKPLLKQSFKANFGIWAFVTIVTCATLAVVISVLGNLNISGIRDSMVNAFVKDAIENNVEVQSMTFFNIADDALYNFDDSSKNLNILLNVQMNDLQKTIITSNYNNLKNQGMTHEQAKNAILSQMSDQNQILATRTLLDYYAMQGNDYSQTKINEYVLLQIQDGVYNNLVATEGEDVANEAKSFITTAINTFITSNATNTTEFATDYIPNVVKSLFITQEIDNNGNLLKISDFFTGEELQKISKSSIILFRAEVEIEHDNLLAQGKTDAEVENELIVYKSQYIKNHTGGLLDSIPKDVATSLSELGSMDIFALVVGEMFYRIAGILLPMIFVIMCSNNLIATQVDTGSMAYILSTPTKRKKVTITQMLFLILSLFVMCLFTTITSVISLSLVTTEISITIPDILLFNLSSFFTLVAISGINFLASSWFNKSSKSMAVGGGLSIFFLVATILGLFGSEAMPSAIKIEAMNYFNYVSIISLFDTTSILEGTLAWLWKIGILLIISIVTYTISIIKFDKKDLPL